MKLFRAIIASATAAIAFAYIPPYMELPQTWTDVTRATVRTAIIIITPSHDDIETCCIKSDNIWLNLFTSFIVLPRHCKHQLAPLEISSEVASFLQESDESPNPVVTESSCMIASEVIRKHTGKHGCIAFAVRRPG